MVYAICTIFGFLLGAGLIFALVENRRKKSQADRLAAESAATFIRDEQSKIAEGRAKLDSDRAAFDNWSVPIGHLERENEMLKRDLLNIDTTVRKLRLDDALRVESQRVLDERSKALSERYLADVEKWVGASISANNYAACKQRLTKAIEWVREIGFDVSEERESGLFQRLKADFEMEVRSAIEKEEQARIKAQIREEQAREREIQREIDRLNREREVIKAALDRAMLDTTLAHSAEVERLKARLAEAEERGQRAISQAQLTRSGHIYVISNIGSFGDGVFKIGMTRRLEPIDRIQELGDASVPFPFDVHMMISCDDAPALERAIHHEFMRSRINKVNPRKEFFRIELETIRKFVEQRHGQVRFTADAEALEYRQGLTMSEADERYIEGVFERAEAETGASEVEE